MHEQNRIRSSVVALLDTSPDAIISVDRDGLIVDFNAAAEQMFGADRQLMAGRPIGVLFADPTDRGHTGINPWHRKYDAGAAGANHRLIETEGRRADGTQFPIELRITAAPREYPACDICYVRDITERKLAASALQESANRYRDLVENAAFGIFRSTGDGRFVSVNRALVEMLGYEHEVEVLPLDIATDVYVSSDERRRILENHVGRSVETEWKRKDGTRITVRLSGRAVSERDETHYDVFVEDITGRRGLEQQLAQAQRVDTLGRFAGGIAHDFNNILTVIAGYAQTLLDDDTLVDSHRRFIQQVSRAAARAASLTRQILAFSRKQLLQPVVIDLNEALLEIQALLERVIGEHIAIDMRLCGEPVLINADPTQIEQIVINLAVNARDAMPDGGTLRIETLLAPLDDAFVERHVGSAPGPHVRLAVTDTGVGMTADIVHKVFEPFFTTKDRGRGTGLGLSTTYGIVKQSGGSIWVTSEPGVGTVFEVYLPLTTQTALPVTDTTPSPPRGSGGETVLLVEDDEGVRLLASLILTRIGYHVIAPIDEHEVLKIGADRSIDIDVLLTDVVMPRISGVQLASRLRELRPGLRTLYMSGYTDDIIARHGVLEPGTLLLQKPFTRESLASKLRDALDTPPAP